jgi:hypothetical protein
MGWIIKQFNKIWFIWSTTLDKYPMLLISDYENDLYYRQVMVDLCLQHGIDDVSLFGIGARFTALAHKLGTIKVEPNKKSSVWFVPFKIVMCTLLSILAIPILFLASLHVLRHINWLTPPSVVSSFDSLFFSHSKSGASKVLSSRYWNGSLCVLHDSLAKELGPDDESLFSTFSLAQIIFRLPYMFPLLIVRDYLACLVMLALSSNNGLKDMFYLLDFAIRIPHKCLYEISMSLLLKKNSFSQVITANKEDRFAMLETRLCHSLKIPLVCIPHGMEYQLAFPTGLAGDKFYCTSETAKKVLSSQYKDQNKFVYDHTFQDKIYSKHSTSQQFRRIILFTEPRVPHVNLAICKFLLDSDVKFYVKIHPTEKKEFYSTVFKGLEFEDSYDSAIRGNVCLARTSSALIEALHNKSRPVSVIVNDYDSFVVDNLLPSLRCPDVERADGLLALGELLATIDLKNSVD